MAMREAAIRVGTRIERTPRVLQVEGLFDLQPTERVRLQWRVALPLDERPWQVGLIVGPSGCGKTTIARRLWPEPLAAQAQWPRRRAVLDAFPPGLPIKEIVKLLSSVGFSSPPAWLRPYHVLSTGEQFRVRLARLLAEQPRLAVMDEFTSVVDRTVAQLGAHAVARTVRARGQRFVAVTCHKDIEPWLNPDWVYRPDTNTFTWRLLRPRPAIGLAIRRVGREAWALFQQHHYLSDRLAANAACFGAFWCSVGQDSNPIWAPGRGLESWRTSKPLVAFSAWIPSLRRGGGRREHRTVTLPDYQGVGIGHALSTFMASVWKALGERATSTTTHPAFIASRRRSRDWKLVRPPSLGRADGRGRVRHAVTRLTAGFEYMGPPLPLSEAQKLLG
jgi:GNAT superfamily N-acetyltransferase